MSLQILGENGWNDPYIKTHFESQQSSTSENQKNLKRFSFRLKTLHRSIEGIPPRAVGSLTSQLGVVITLGMNHDTLQLGLVNPSRTLTVSH